jgi:hypothetical protein
MLLDNCEAEAHADFILSLCRSKPDEASLPRHPPSRPHVGRSPGGNVHLYLLASGRRACFRYRAFG